MAASLVGHLKLDNLCWVYDNNNNSTIEGKTALTYSVDAATRFIGYGWNVTRVSDANDLEMHERAFRTFNSSDRPTLIIVDSHIEEPSQSFESGTRNTRPLNSASGRKR
jgi:transketolase